MRNFVQPGVTITVTAPYAIAAGAGCLVGILFGISAGTYTSGATDAEIVTEGVFDVACLSTDTPAQGAALYWDNTNKRLTTTASGNTKVGVATVAKADGATTAQIRLNGSF